MFPVNINDNEINILIDSGSTTNIIDEPTYSIMSPKPLLTSSNKNIYPYQANKLLTVTGEFTATVTANNETTKTKFHVIPGNSGSLLG